MVLKAKSSLAPNYAYSETNDVIKQELPSTT